MSSEMGGEQNYPHWGEAFHFRKPHCHTWGARKTRRRSSIDMDQRNRFPFLVFFILAGIAGIILLAVAVIFPGAIARISGTDENPTSSLAQTTDIQPISAFTSQPTLAETEPIALTETETMLSALPLSLADLYDRMGPGVVSIKVYTQQGGSTGQAAGSGFILDEEGHIVTNNHVVADAFRVTVVFYNGYEEQAEVIGTDEDSDLAVIKVDQLIGDVHPLSLGDSGLVDVGEWVIAIGNPFGNQNSMSVGIISAVGRTIPTGSTPFSIPQSIQTDAAINPGNSGGPLISLEGVVIGVNAQIATNGNTANSGVGFAIPVNILRNVVPVLMEEGSYDWPWLGVEGTDLTLAIAEANQMETRLGAYINNVVSGGPSEAFLEGSSGSVELDGIITPIGGDVVIAADGMTIRSFDDLLTAVAFKHPGEVLSLTVLRDGKEEVVSIELQSRP
jgi:S1-C subfamily serine protease